MGKMFWLYALLLSLSTVHAARILAVFPVGAKSHHRFMHPLVMAMARAGHEVVMYSPFPTLIDNQPANVTHVHLGNIVVVDQSADMDKFIEEVTANPFWKCLDLQWTYFDHLYSEVMNDDKMKELFRSNEKFDLIVTETFTAQEFTLILSKKFNAPVIGLQAFPLNNVVNSFLGNSLSISFIPDTCAVFSNKMTFVERLLNTFSIVRGLYYHYNHFLPKMESLLRREFPDAPPLLELTKNVSLMFVNDHLTADFTQPRTPNIIPVAGIHIEPPTPLPKNIQTFMDGATDGVIFFSLGTYVLDDQEPKEYFDMYINIFKKLKQRVLWKTKKSNVEGLPPNVMTLQWAPQKDILGHPKCVLFITHGGQLSRVEALHFGVPVVSIPQFYDQHKNSEFYVHTGVGVKISRTELSEETMSAAIRKVLNNKSYREKMKRLSAIFRDLPLSPEESVVFWTEYVLRHGGAAHLRPASTDLRWYQLILLDVIVAVVTISCLLAAIIFILLRTVLLKLISSKEITSKGNKKKIN